MQSLTAEQFVQKYGATALNNFKSTQSTDTNTPTEFGKGIVKGALGRAIETASLLQSGGKTIMGALGADISKLGEPSLDTATPEGAGVQETLRAKNPTQEAGKTAETIAEYLMPFVSSGTKLITEGTLAAKEGIQAGIGAVKESSPTIAKAVLGEADTQIVKSGQNPMVKLFKTGTKRVSDVVGSVNKAITTFETNSKAELQAVKDAIPDIKLPPKDIAERINKGIIDSIQHSADYRGIKTGLETAEDIIQSGILKPEEAKRVEDVVKFASNWKDTSARGALNLKESLSNFYATGENYKGSNAIIRSMQRNLVDLVGETAPEIKPALKKASQNIDKTEEFITHLAGKDPISGESKILQLARNLSDKAKNGIKVDLIKELEKVSGMKIQGDLQGIYDYLESSKMKFPGIQKPVEAIRYGVKKAIEKNVPLK